MDTSVMETSVMETSVMQTSKSRANKTFKQHLIEDLCCSFCLLVLDEPMMTVCDHLFCKKCLINYTKKCSQCPICKGRIGSNTTRPVPNVINNILNKLKAIKDCRFPFNQMLELRCVAERVDLIEDNEDQSTARSSIVDFFRTEATPNSPHSRTNLLDDFHQSVSRTIANPSTLQAAYRSPIGGTTQAAPARELRSNVQNSLVNRLNALNATLNATINATANTTRINLVRSPGNQRTGPSTGLQTNVMVSSLISAFVSPMTERSYDLLRANRMTSGRPTVANSPPARLPNNPRHTNTTNDSTPEATNGIKKSLKKQFIEEVTCPICLSTIDEPYLLACNHVYCKNCILIWLKMDDKTCPVCKKYVQPSSPKAGPRVLKKIILKLNGLPDIDLEAPSPSKRKIVEVICLDLDEVRRPVPKPKKFAGQIPVVVLD